MIMDNQTIYNEAMAKFAEAQKCQDEIAGCNHELQQVNEAIAEVCNVFNVYKTKIYLNYRCNTLNNKLNNYTRERDEKLNEALSKALDLADDETSKGFFLQNSSGVQATTAILLYIGMSNIKWQCSVNVKIKLSKLVNKGVNFIEIQRQYNWLWQSVFGNANNW